MASVSSAAIRYKGSGAWEDVAGWDDIKEKWVVGNGWQGGAVPTAGDCRLNWGNNIVTLDYAAPAVSIFHRPIIVRAGDPVGAYSTLIYRHPVH